MRCSVPIVRSVGAMKNEAYAAAPISDTTIAAKMARFHMTLHSSKRYSPKSHKAVKNTMSNATKNPMPFHTTYGDRSSSAAVTSVLAIRIGVSIGNSNSGNSNSRIRACAEIDDNAVPAIETPRLPRKNTSTSQCNTPATCTVHHRKHRQQQQLRHHQKQCVRCDLRQEDRERVRYRQPQRAQRVVRLLAQKARLQ